MEQKLPVVLAAAVVSGFIIYLASSYYDDLSNIKALLVAAVIVVGIFSTAILREWKKHK